MKNKYSKINFFIVGALSAWIGFGASYILSAAKIRELRAKHYHEKFELEDKLKECKAKIHEYNTAVFDCVPEFE